MSPQPVWEVEAFVGADARSSLTGIDGQLVPVPRSGGEPTSMVFALWADSTPDPLVLAAVDGGRAMVSWVNHAAAAMLRAAPADLVGLPLSDLQVASDNPDDADLLISPLRASRSTRTLVPIRRRDGSTTVATVVAVPLPVGMRGGWLMRLSEEAQQAVVDDRILVAESRLRALAERAPVGIAFSETGVRLGYANDHLARILGVPADRLLGTQWLQYVHDEDLPGLQDALAGVLEGHRLDRQLRFACASGHRWVHIRAEAVTVKSAGTGFVLTVLDVTDQRDREQRLAYEARHDALTGLPNRIQLADHVAAMSEDPRRWRKAGIALLDLDGFKRVNDERGHEAGDRLLVAVATGLRSAARSDDLVVRLGGDEFVVVADGLAHARELRELGRRLCTAVRDAAKSQAPGFVVSASIGVVTPNGPLESLAQLLRRADEAMYTAKSTRVGTVVVPHHDEKEDD